MRFCAAKLFRVGYYFAILLWHDDIVLKSQFRLCQVQLVAKFQPLVFILKQFHLFLFTTIFIYDIDDVIESTNAFFTWISQIFLFFSLMVFDISLVSNVIIMQINADVVRQIFYWNTSRIFQIKHQHQEKCQPIAIIIENGNKYCPIKKRKESHSRIQFQLQ